MDIIRGMSKASKERDRSRRTGLISTAVVVGAMGAGGLLARSCQTHNTATAVGMALRPEPDMDPTMERTVSAYTLRLDVEMRNMTDAQKVKHLLQEVQWSVGMRTRGVMDPDNGDFYFDFAPRIAAVRRVANRAFSRPEYQKKLVESLERTRRMLESPQDNGLAAAEVVNIFNGGYDTQEEAVTALLRYTKDDPEFHQKLQDEISSGYNDACQRLIQEQGQGRGRGQP